MTIPRDMDPNRDEYEYHEEDDVTADDAAADEVGTELADGVTAYEVTADDAGRDMDAPLPDDSEHPLDPAEDADDASADEHADNPHPDADGDVTATS